MKIKTKFDIHQRVFYCDFREEKVYELTIETIKIGVSLMYSGGGGTMGMDIGESYFDEDGTCRAGHNLYKTRKEAEVAIKEYKERFPYKVCSECGNKISISKSELEKEKI